MSFAYENVSSSSAKSLLHIFLDALNRGVKPLENRNWSSNTLQERKGTFSELREGNYAGCP